MTIEELREWMMPWAEKKNCRLKFRQRVFREVPPFYSIRDVDPKNSSQTAQIAHA